MSRPRRTLARVLSRVSRWGAAVTLCAVMPGAVAVAQEEAEPPPSKLAEDEIKCTVRAEYNEQLNEAFSTGPTVEEASDAALESTCALLCVPTEPAEPDPTKAANPDPKTAKSDKKAPAPSADAPAEDDGASDAMEACIEKCADEAIVIGTICVDAKKSVVYVDGAFDPDAPPEE